jgi:hypothetical protein
LGTKRGINNTINEIIEQPISSNVGSVPGDQNHSKVPPINKLAGIGKNVSKKAKKARCRLVTP